MSFSLAGGDLSRFNLKTFQTIYCFIARYLQTNLDSVACLWCDALHGQDDLECLVRDVPGTHFV